MEGEDAIKIYLRLCKVAFGDEAEGVVPPAVVVYDKREGFILEFERLGEVLVGLRVDSGNHAAAFFAGGFADRAGDKQQAGDEPGKSKT